MKRGRGTAARLHACAPCGGKPGEMIEPALEKKALRTIDRYGMLSGGDTVVVSVSGGADSVALLAFLNSRRREFGIDISVFHMDHMIRGRESADDARYVKELAEGLGLTVRVAREDVPSLTAGSGLSPQDVARRVRIEGLTAYAEEVGAGKIAVGHTADDQVETFLMRVVQGAGLTGLGCIPPVSGKVVRPLIDVWRSEVEAYCRALGIVPRVDSSNLGDDYLRNRVRNRLIPFLEREFSPGVKRVILREVESLDVDREFMRLKGDEAFRALARAGAGEVRLPIGPLERLPLSMRRRVVRRAWETLLPGERGLAWRHVIDILEKVAGGRTGSRLDLPRSLTVEREYDFLVFRPAASVEEALEGELPVPGRLRLPGCVLEAREVDACEADFTDDPNVEYVRPDATSPFSVRAPLPGDRFEPLGAGGTRKLKDFFIDEKVPRRERSRCPLVTSAGQIVWVAGHRLDRRFALRPWDGRAVRLLLLRDSD